MTKNARASPASATISRRALKEALPEAVIFGANAPRLSNTSNVALPGLRGREYGDRARSGRRDGEFRLVLLVGQDRRLACAVGDGDDDDLAGASIRVSFGWNSSKEDADAVVASLVKLRQRARPRAAA